MRNPTDKNNIKELARKQKQEEQLRRKEIVPVTDWQLNKRQRVPIKKDHLVLPLDSFCFFGAAFVWLPLCTIALPKDDMSIRSRHETLLFDGGMTAFVCNTEKHNNTLCANMYKLSLRVSCVNSTRFQWVLRIQSDSLTVTQT